MSPITRKILTINAIILLLLSAVLAIWRLSTALLPVNVRPEKYYMYDIVRQTFSDKWRYPKKPNILFVLIDTLRADHLGVYGYERNTSPVIDAFSEGAIRFEHFFSVAPWTNPAIATIFTGRYPQSVMPAEKHKDAIRRALPGGAQILPEVLRTNGFKTIGLVDHPGINAKLGFARGFDEFTYLKKRSAEQLGQKLGSYESLDKDPVEVDKETVESLKAMGYLNE